MEKYENYKDSGIEWIGKIPDHWEVKKLKYIIQKFESGVSVNSIDRSIEEGEYGILKTSCVSDYSFRPKKNKLILNEIELERARIHPSKGNIIISRMNTPDLVGASGYVDKDYNNLFLPDRLWQTVFFENIDFSSRFISFILKSDSFKRLISVLASGTSPSMKNISQSDYLNINIPFPFGKEQTTIANYLDKKTSELDQLISEKKQLIKFYQEEKTAVINQAVTKGINPDVKLKDSGIEWLGDIPEHWEVGTIKSVSSYFKGMAFKSESFKQKGIPIIKASNIKESTIKNITSFISLDNQHPNFEKVRLLTGDIIMSTVGSKPEVINSAVGQLAYISEEFSNSYLNQNTICIRANNKIQNTYLNYVLHSKYIRAKIDSIALWMANQAYIEVEKVRGAYTPIPNIDEQTQIVQHIEKESARIDSKIAKAKKYIKLLTEYRTTLISEVVTGKIKVTN